MILNSYAKLNLFLEVLGKRSDNYHNITTLFERISLCDKIILKIRNDTKIKIFSDSSSIPKGSSNLAYKAAKLLQESFKTDKGVEITIKKRIPVSSGMGGGSSNAATVLIGLNRLWKLNLTRKELLEYAKIIGADVGFFIYDTAFALGVERGDEIKSLSALKGLKFRHIIVVPRIKVSTPLIYGKWDELYGSNTVKTDRLTNAGYNVNILSSALKKKDFSLISKTLFNGLEPASFEIYPEIKTIKETLADFGIKPILMSGSGPTVFGFVSSGREVLSLCRRLKKNRFWQVFTAQTA